VLEAALGFVAGLVTSVPMLGPVVLLIFSAGVEAHLTAVRREALALALGAALAEGVHVALAVFGVAPLLLARPEIAVGLRLLAGLALIALALVAWRARAAGRALMVRSRPRAFVLGVLLVLPNPGFLVTWVAVLAFAEAHGQAGWGVPFVVGAVLGIAVWFFSVYRLAWRLGPRIASRLTQLRVLVAAGLALLGLWLVAAALALV
jgi:threonine/homoserine/homoserine lactone efflux protein